MTGFIKLRSDQNKTHVQYGFESAKLGPGKNQTGTCINWFFILEGTSSDPPFKEDYDLITMVQFKSFVQSGINNIYPFFVYLNCAYSFYVDKNSWLIFHFILSDSNIKVYLKSL